MDKEPQRRTNQQSKSLHLFCRLIADTLNDAGLTVQLVLKPDVAIDFTPSLVKELLWRPVQKAITGKQSTKDLNKQQEIDLIYDTINRHLGERFGLHVPFPSNEIGYNDVAHLRGDNPDEAQLN